MPSRHILTIPLLALALLACEDRPGTSIVPNNPSRIADAGAVGDSGVEPDAAPIIPQVNPNLCTPGERICLSENSPLYAECDPQGRTYRELSCPPSTVCDEGVCVPFNCVPGRPVCIGADASGTCDPTGRGVLELEPCDGDLVCRGGSCVDLCAEAAEQSSYIGCEYTAIEMFNLYRAESANEARAPYALIVANPQRFSTARVRVTDYEGRFARLLSSVSLAPRQQYDFARNTLVRSEVFTPDGTIQPPTSSASLDVPPSSAAVMLIDPDISGVGPFKVTSTVPTVAYQYSPYCCNFTATNDASLLLPNATLGTRYRALSYPAMDFEEGSPSIASPYLYVVANEDDTSVTVAADEELAITNTRSAGWPAPTIGTSTTHTVELRAGEARAFTTSGDLGGGDLSGALVTSNKPIAVFAGHPCTFIPQNRSACDHLEEQLFPSQALGQRYVLHPVHSRNRQDYSEETVYWRVVADEDATLSVSPSFAELEATRPSTNASPSCADLSSDGSTFTLSAGEVCEFGTRNVGVLDSDAPIIVGGFVSGHESTGVLRYGTQAGDPAFFLVPPLAQTRRDYSFVTSPTFKRTYVSVVAPARARLTLDDSFVTAEQRLEAQLFELDDEEWIYFSLSLQPGLHRMGGDLDFSIVVHAYDDYVSYAFPGGLDLTPNPKER